MANVIRQDVVAVEFLVEDEGLKEILAMLKEMEGEAAGLADAADLGLGEIQETAKAAADGVGNLGNEIKKSAGGMGDFADGAQKGAAGMGELGKEINQGTGEAKNFTQTLTAMAGALGLAGAAQIALGGLKNAFGKATARIDTMEQFGRVMTAMTGDAKAAAAAQEEVRQAVLGTAYGLDTAAVAVQGFVTSGMKAEKAVGDFEALRDAVSFFGKGTNEALLSVTDAWTDMATAGKVSAQDVRTLTLAGIPAYQLYAEAVGLSIEDVKKSLESGAVSAAEFQSVLTKALMNGTASFASVAGAAKEAGTSWAGSFDNAKAAVTRGAQAIILAIDDTRTAMGDPTMREGIAEFGKTAEKALNGVAKILPPVVKNLDALAIAAGGVAVAFAAQKAVTAWAKKMDVAKDAMLALSQSGKAFTATLDKQAVAQARAAAMQELGNKATEKEIAVRMAESGVVTASTFALGGYAGGQTAATTATQLGTAAVAKFNAVLAANPVLFLVGGLALLAGGVHALNMSFNEEYQNAARLRSQLKELTQSHDELMQSIDQSAVDNMAGIEAIRDKADAVRGLVGELGGMVDENGRVSGSAEDVQEVIAQINAQFPEMNLGYDKATNSISGTTEAMLEQVKTMESADLSNSAKGYAETLGQQMAETKQQWEELKNQAKEMEDAGLDLNISAKSGEVIGVAPDFQRLLDDIAENEQKQNSISAEMVENAKNLQEVTEVLRDTAVDELAGKWGLAAGELQTAYNSSGMALEEWTGKQEALLAQAQQIYDGHVAGIVNSFQALPGAYQQSAAEMLQIMRDNTAQTADFQKNLAELSGAGGLSEAAIAQFEAMGPAVNSVLEEILAGGPAAIAEWNAAFADMSVVASDMTFASDELAAAAKEAGMVSGDEFVLAIDTKMGEAGTQIASSLQTSLTTAMATMAPPENLLEAYTPPELDAVGFQTNLTAVETAVATAGTNIGLSLDTLKLKMTETQTAMSTEMTTIVTNVQTMATDVLTALNGLAEPLYTAGVDAMAGFNNGLESQRETVLATAASIASEAAASMRGALEIHSPSRVVQEIGVYTGQGLPLGMESQRGAVQREAQALALAALPPVVPSPPVAPAMLPQQGLPPMVPFMLPPKQAEAGPPLLAPRTPETAPVTARGGNTYNQNQYSPQFSLTIGGGATAQNRETERQVRTWIREEFGKMLRAAGRGAPAAREV